MTSSAARRSTLHFELDSQLHWAPVRRNFWVGGKWIIEIPVKIIHARRVEKSALSALSLTGAGVGYMISNKYENDV
jgi:hypothetical protein